MQGACATASCMSDVPCTSVIWVRAPAMRSIMVRRRLCVCTATTSGASPGLSAGISGEAWLRSRYSATSSWSCRTASIRAFVADRCVLIILVFVASSDVPRRCRYSSTLVEPMRAE
eukprot:Mycagemm_TRINITY_DN10280_c0_g9::TRINITY_DN10280_c0_g9_i1::g.3769::m.3769 type:complete len:116 gc:universal TRINITY_DN10280_c0_g9_i1:274-621(+)